MPKFIFVTGGVLSGIGKGHTTASIAKLLQFRGYEIDLVKIDPYLNVDPGTLNPVEHGEPFITDQIYEFNPAPSFRYTTAEVDQDFGTYERFVGRAIHPRNNITSGQVYLSVILQERLGKFLGKTVQIIPHVTDEIKRRFHEIATAGKLNDASLDVIIVEVGGTVGDIEAAPFLEAIRQFRLDEGRNDTLLVHVTLVPLLPTVGELKTKPTQHSVKQLLSLGLQPDIIIARSQKPLTNDARQKIALYSNVSNEAVIAMPGKYVNMTDTYVSINEALRHAGAHRNTTVTIEMVDAETLEQASNVKELFHSYDGILLTPGFGTRGTEGMIRAAWFAFEEDFPFLGICFGCQLLFVALCRYALGMKKANSTELNPNTPYPVVDLLPEQREIQEKGGTMRLGGHSIRIRPKSKLRSIYKKAKVRERFRHRFHLMWKPAQKAEKIGLVISATDATEKIINAIELKNRFWMIGTQFHPEYSSRPDLPNPIYLAFVDAMLNWRHQRGQVH